MREPPGPLWGRAASCCLWPHGCSGRRVVCCRAGLLGVPVGGGPPARRPRRELRSARRLEARPGPAGLAAASNRSGCLCVARPGPAAAHWHRSQALLCPPVPPAPSTPAGPGVLVCCSSFRNFACNSPPALCWFVSVCDVTPLVFVNCMRLLLSAGPAAHGCRGGAVLTFPVLQADQTGCVRG